MFNSMGNYKFSSLQQSFFITVACLGAYIIGPSSTFETNDDVYYQLLYSGKLLSSSPTPDVLVVNIVLSKFFTWLYTVIPGISWYGFAHTFTIFLSVLFLNYCYSIAHNADKFLARLLVSLICTLPFLIFIQFTKTSFLLATTGYLSLYIINNSSNSSHFKNIYLHSCAIFFLVFSFCLRKESFLLATILCSLLMMQLIIRRRTFLIASLSVLTATIIIFSVIHKKHYGQDWQNSTVSWAKVIGPIIDYGQIDYETNKEVFTKVGWSKNDYYFLNIWGFVDNRIYGPKQIDYIHNHAKKVTSALPDISNTLQSALSLPGKNYILTASGLTLLLLLLYRQQYSYWYFLVLPPILCCIIFLVWQGRFPPRISTPLSYFLPWVLITQSTELRKQTASYWISTIVLLMLTIPIYGQFKDLSALTRTRIMQNKNLHALGTVTSKTPITLITMGASFPFEGILPFESPDFLSGARIIWLCSMNQTPIQNKQIADAGIKDIFVSLLDDPSTYIAIDPNFLGILQRYIVEHYNVKTDIVVSYASKNFVVFKVVPKDNLSQSKENKK